MVDPLIVVIVTLSLLIFICPRFIWCLIDRRNIRRNRNTNSNADPFVIIVEGEIINDYEYEGLNEDDIRNVNRGIVI